MIKLARTFALLRNTFQIQTIISNRTLYSPSALGIDGYLVTREKIKNQFLNNEIKFREKMKEYVENQSGMIFTEDLKNMVHIADKEDIELVIKMIEKFHTQNRDINFGNYVFGPVVMRMFYHLGEVDLAFNCFLNKELERFFNQPTSYQILLDMLYENKHYDKVLQAFDIINARLEQNVNTYKHAITLTFAACYKINTPESFQRCLELWRELNTRGYKTMRKTVTFAAGLALKQNSPHIALELVSVLKEQQYLTVRNIKVQAYAELNRPEDALPVLRSILEVDEVVSSTKQTFIRDVINKVGESIQRNHKKDLENDFNRIVKFLNENGHITDQTMDDILCLQITTTSINAPRRDHGYLAATFSRDRSNTRNPTMRRQGLQDLY